VSRQLHRQDHSGDALAGPEHPPASTGAALSNVRRNEAITHLAFAGRRRQVYARLTRLCGAQPGDRVLDVGCGGGYLTRLLAAAVRPGGQVTGIDPAPEAVAYARRRARAGCTYVVGTAQHLDFPDRSADVIISTLAMHHIPETGRAAALAEMYRVLRPGGTLLLADFGPSATRRGLHARLSAIRHSQGLALEDLAAAAGLDIRGRGDLRLLRYVTAVRPAGA
jgi:SAM-dependent methyltransferase